ncbi:YihY/virulence factor BrkB family protein [Glaciibacter flavus]|uniref:YihY/virulence factor BrkB family protein n=1 Tax=Orlajensenia flava TaxID=2565934 RepID=UPI003B00FE55
MSSETASKKQADAPAPDDERKPDSPTEVTRRSWGYVAKKTFREFISDQCPDIAASLVYYAVLSLFPALLAITSLLGVFGQGKSATTALLGIVRDVAPGGTVEIIRKPLEQFAASPAAGFALVTGIVLAIWSASGYVGAFSRAMNRIYEIEEGRPFWKLRTTQLVVTVIAIVLILLIATLLVVSGPVTDAVGDALGVGAALKVTWSIVKWPVLAFAVILILAVLYYASPNAKQPKFRWVSLGAILALVVLLIASVGFGFYVTNFSNYDRTYGSFAGIIIFLLWLWIANLALLFGAELDAELERGRQLQAGIAAEENIKLPPRDTVKSDKKDKQEQADVEEGRRIRLSNGEDDGSEADEKRAEAAD